MKILKGLYTGYGLVVFALVFIILFPFLCIPILFPRQYNMIGIINRWWARIVFTLIGMPFKVEYRANLERNRQYIFCPNHFSYLDIPAVGLNKCNTIFVGKTDMENIPLFGFMYRKLHITVDRDKLKSRYTTMLRSFEALDAGKSLVIFPEGGIITEREPVMARFKDGAFRAAIEKQISLVPVTIPYNWIILPADRFLLGWGKVMVIFHEPIDTTGMTLNDVETLKARTRNVIHTELNLHLPHENRS